MKMQNEDKNEFEKTFNDYILKMDIQIENSESLYSQLFGERSKMTRDIKDLQ